MVSAKQQRAVLISSLDPKLPHYNAALRAIAGFEPEELVRQYKIANAEKTPKIDPFPDYEKMVETLNARVDMTQPRDEITADFRAISLQSGEELFQRCLQPPLKREWTTLVDFTFGIEDETGYETVPVGESHHFSMT